MATSIELSGDRRFGAATHARLIHGAKAAASAEQAWLYLKAAHVVGLLHLRPHLQTHTRMLGLANRTRDRG